VKGNNMPEYWLDADSFIRASRTAYRFSFDPPFWGFLQEKAQYGVIGSPSIVFDQELASSNKIAEKDLLELWAREQRETLFITPDESVQHEFSRVVNYVQSNGRFSQHNIASFMSGADPWMVAYAMAHGGKIVTFEVSALKSTNPKIPDIANEFGVECINLWDMLTELDYKGG